MAALRTPLKDVMICGLGAGASRLSMPGPFMVCFWSTPVADLVILMAVYRRIFEKYFA